VTPAGMAARSQGTSVGAPDHLVLDQQEPQQARRRLRMIIPPGGLVAAALVVAVGASAGGLSWTMQYATYDTFAGVLIGITLALVSIAIMRRIARRERDLFVARVLIAAPLLKLAATLARLAAASVLYDGIADANVYHAEGVRLSAFYREGIFNADLGRPFVGTGFIRALCGVVYTVTGPTKLGASFLFSWAGFWGLYLMFRAFSIAIPEGDRRRYVLLVLLLPSLLFWPSSIGKEAWITLMLGLFAYGAARLLTAKRHAFIALLVGGTGVAVVRPHIAAIAVFALVCAYVFRRQPQGATITGPLRKIAGLAFLGAGLAFATTQTQSLLGVDSFNSDAVRTASAAVVARTSEGGSVFETRAVTSLDPREFPSTLVGVLFRPFPWESNNGQAFVASAEGMLLLVLFAASWRRIVGGLRSVLRTPYVVFCMTYTVLFVYGFASFSNYGILTRQRVQVIPFAVVLIALPPFTEGRHEWRHLLTDEPKPVR
jgi:hypothetical protein